MAPSEGYDARMDKLITCCEAVRDDIRAIAARYDEAEAREARRQEEKARRREDEAPAGCFSGLLHCGRADVSITRDYDGHAPAGYVLVRAPSLFRDPCAPGDPPDAYFALLARHRDLLAGAWGAETAARVIALETAGAERRKAPLGGLVSLPCDAAGLADTTQACVKHAAYLAIIRAAFPDAVAGMNARGALLLRVAGRGGLAEIMRVLDGVSGALGLPLVIGEVEVLAMPPDHDRLFPFVVQMFIRCRGYPERKAAWDGMTPEERARILAAGGAERWVKRSMVVP